MIVCEYCEKNKPRRVVQLWTGWIKRLCVDCIKNLKVEYRYLTDENNKPICYTDKQNDEWGCN